MPGRMENFGYAFSCCISAFFFLLLSSYFLTLFSFRPLSVFKSGLNLTLTWVWLDIRPSKSVGTAISVISSCWGVCYVWSCRNPSSRCIHVLRHKDVHGSRDRYLRSCHTVNSKFILKYFSADHNNLQINEINADGTIGNRVNVLGIQVICTSL
jgi:hypothetical protein